MKSCIIIGLTGTALVAAQGSLGDWHPAGPNDFRGPCPMLNTLANHGFLPHSGKSITVDSVKYALGTALNISEELSQFLFERAIMTATEPNATTFSLKDLGRHNILEHDASLSRSDYYFTQDPYTFNASVFAETRSYWPDPTINIAQAATARLARLKTSNTTNPTFSLSSLGSGFSIGETAAYIIILGDMVEGTVRRDRVEYLFEQERLPVRLGWTTSGARLNAVDLFDFMNRVVNATTLSEEEKDLVRRKPDLHVDIRQCPICGVSPGDAAASESLSEAKNAAE